MVGIRVFLTFFLFLFVLTSQGWPQKSPENIDDPNIYTLPELTVTDTESNDYTTLPPRDLIKRPYTESPGLQTATSVIGQKEIQRTKAYSVVDALKYIPGAWTETRGRKVKEFFSVRGQRYPYPGYTIAGVWFREFHETNYFLLSRPVSSRKQA